MSRRTLTGLLLVLAGAWLLWAGVRVFSGREIAPEVPSGLTAVFEEGDEDTWSALRIVPSGAQPIEIERVGSEWQVGGFRADSALVRRFFGTLGDATVSGMAARNPANHERMGVGPASADTLRLTAGEEAGTVLLGGAGARSGTMFVRLPDQDEVYLLERDLTSYTTRDIEGWRSRRMASVDSSLVHRIEIARGGTRDALVRGDSAWTLGDAGPPADPATVRDLLSEFSNLTASGFTGEGDSLASLPRAARVTLLDTSGDTLTTLTLGAGEGDRWATIRGDSVRYRVSGFRAERMVPTLGELTRS